MLSEKGKGPVGTQMRFQLTNLSVRMTIGCPIVTGSTFAHAGSWGLPEMARRKNSGKEPAREGGREGDELRRRG